MELLKESLKLKLIEMEAFKILKMEIYLNKKRKKS